jgi:prefoldin subunit 5
VDVERTIEFILEGQARLTSGQEQLNSSLNRLTAIVDRTVALFAESKAETDRRREAAGSSLKASLESLAEAQKVTEQKLQAFIDNLNKGRNGHP